MSRRRKGDAINGVVLLDKPTGISSNHALQRVRRIFNARKGGHTGTLDPFATGMLPVCLGEATKTSTFMLASDKCYRATALLGVATTTGDLEGEVIQRSAAPNKDDEAMRRVLQRFRGEIQQVPPMYSALKHEGRPLYEYAREGKVIERKPRTITIHDIRLVSWESPYLVFDVLCSKGTYVRTLAEDIARQLNSCGHLVALRRTWTDPFRDLPMVTLEVLEGAQASGSLEEHLLPLDAGLVSLEQVSLHEASSVAFQNGNPVDCREALEGLVRVNDEAGHPLGLGEAGKGKLQPKKVYVRE